MKRRAKVGDWFEVRREAEILSTLDEHGRLDGMPFMPEMLQFCGQRFQVFKSAHKTCDSVALRSRRLEDTVHLQTRCSGEAHGGCQAGCLLFWREAWLRPVAAAQDAVQAAAQGAEKTHVADVPCAAEALASHTFVQEGGSVRYFCQATEIRNASRALSWWDMHQYIEDLRSRNVGMWQALRSLFDVLWISMARAGKGSGRAVRWIYDHLRFLWRGLPFPRRVGTIPKGQRTPAAVLNLQPGELVRIRCIEEIDRTLDTGGHNRGLYFDPEQVPYAGRTFRVLRRVSKIINEADGRMIELKTPCVALDSVVCQGRYSSCRVFCPRSAYALWHEAWLERCAVSPSSAGTGAISGLPR